MTRITVFRGNQNVPCPIFDLTASSPRWRMLTPDERAIATRTAGQHLISPLAFAAMVLRENLVALRLARTVGEWRERSERFERVKAVMLDGGNEEDFRGKYLEPVMVRYKLLGANRDEAERNAIELIESALAFLAAGRWQPIQVRPPVSGMLAEYLSKLGPEDRANQLRRLECAPIALWEPEPNPADIEAVRRHAVEREETASLWDADARLLANRSKLWTDEYGDHERRAFPDDWVCPFYAARDSVGADENRECPLAEKRTIPDRFTRPRVGSATQHANDLLLVVRRLISWVADADRVSPLTANHIAENLGQLRVLLRSDLASTELLERLNRHRPTNYAVAGWEEPSVHQAVERLALVVFSAFQQAITSVAPAREAEHDRMQRGRWQWNEVRLALPAVKEKLSELISALGERGFPKITADLRRESAQLLEQAETTSSLAGGNELPATTPAAAGGRARGGEGENQPDEPPEAATPPPVVPAPEAGEGRQPSQPRANDLIQTEGVLPALLSASDIADRIGQNRSSVTSFLTRHVAKNRECRTEVPNKKPNEPAYLYRTADVWPALQEWLKRRADK